MQMNNYKDHFITKIMIAASMYYLLQLIARVPGTVLMLREPHSVLTGALK